MGKRSETGQSVPQLRAAAEARLAGVPASAAPVSPQELLHELQVHQIELEMQNEALRQTQIALEESRDRYVELYEFSPVGYLTLSYSGMITQANLTAAALLGIERGKLRQRRFSLLVAPEDRDRFHRLFARAMRDGEGPACELALQRGEEGLFHAQVDCLRVVAGTEVPVAHLTLTDVSERRQVEEQRLDHARRQRDLLVREVHHRIKNHLQGLVGLMRLYAKRQPEFARTLEEIVSKVDAIAVVYGLQGRLTSGEVRLADLMGEIAVFLKRPTQASLEIGSEPKCCDCAWRVNEKEGVPLALVLNELMTNAIGHGGAGMADQPPQVSLACACDALGSVLTITNTGKLPADFDYARGKGLGTGLSLIRSLLPPDGAALSFSAEDGRVRVRIELKKPLLVAPASATLVASAAPSRGG